MHVPDGFIDAPVSIAAGVVAAGGIAVCLRGARQRARRAHRPAGRAGRRVRLRGPDAQLPGRGRDQRPPARRRARRDPGRAVHRRAVRGRRAARARAAVRRRRPHRARREHPQHGAASPWSSAGWSSGCSLRMLPRTKAAVTGAAFVAALVSVPACRAGLRRALRDRRHHRRVDRRRSPTAMVGVHVLIGIGEAVITALTVGAVIAVRPDLVYGARDRLPELELRSRRSGRAATPARGGRRMSGPHQHPHGAHRRPGRRPAPRRRRELLREQRSRTGWRRSPPTRASARQEKEHDLGGLAARRLRRPRASTTSGSPAVSPASSASRVTLRARRRARPRWSAVAQAARRRRVEPPDCAGERRPRARALPARARRRPPAAAAVQARGRAAVRPRGRRHPEGAVLGVRRCTPLLLAGVAVVARVPARFVAAADGRRGAVRALRGADAVRRAGRHGRRCSASSLSESGLLGAWNILAKGTLGVVASILLAATTEPRALLLGLRAAAPAGADGADHVLHAPLRRCGQRRDAPDADRPGVARVRRAATYAS